MHLLLNYVPNAVSTHAFSPPAEFYRPKSQGSCSPHLLSGPAKKKKYEQVKRSNLD
jgi:hypothetical protein